MADGGDVRCWLLHLDTGVAGLDHARRGPDGVLDGRGQVDVTAAARTRGNVPGWWMIGKGR